jgi:oligoendopeptidase F
VTRIPLPLRTTLAPRTTRPRVAFARAVAVSLTLLAFAGPSAAEPSPPSRIWDLSPLYADRRAWESERDAVLREVDAIAEVRGVLGRSAADLAAGLDRIGDLRQRGTRLALYGILRREVEPESAELAELYEVGTALEARVESAVAFAWPEILAIGDQRLRAWLADEPRLAPHRIVLLRLLSEAGHRRDAETEAALAAAARWPLLATSVWEELVRSPLGWPRLEAADGSTVEATRSAYLAARRSADPWARRELPRAHLGRLRELESLFGLLLTRRMDADLTLARQRRFASGIDAICCDGMPAGSARRLVDFTLDHLAPLARYAELRSRALGLEEVSYEHLTAPAVAAPPLSIEAALERARAALAPLGDAYLERLDERLAHPWFHFATSPADGFVYGIFPPVGGAPPYFLQTFDGTHDGARRLAGGLVLQMAFADWPAERRFDGRDDPPTWANGLIYVGDLLYDDAAIAAARRPEERVVALVEALDLLARHYYRWALVVALDLEVESRIARAAPPNGAEISRLYLDLLRRGYGTAAVDDSWATEWATFSVPFLSYEHQFWPSAMAAACAVVERLEQGDPRASALAAGGRYGRADTDRSFGLLLEAGVDFRTDGPYRAVERRMNRRLEELERALVELGAAER